MMTVLSDCI